LGDEKGSPEDWRMLARRGGFPTPALELATASDRRIRFDGYVRTYLERDLQDLAAISGLPDFRQLMRAACLRMGQFVNQTELVRDVALPQPTVHRWLNLLETSCLLVRLPAYAVNRTIRLIKAPKFYWGDTRIERAELGYWRTGWHRMCWPRLGGRFCRLRENETLKCDALRPVVNPPRSVRSSARSGGIARIEQR